MNTTNISTSRRRRRRRGRGEREVNTEYLISTYTEIRDK